jgi:Transposase DDE domain/Transposase domain (DUF772)
MPLLSELSDFRDRLQGELFPDLAEAVGPLSALTQLLISVIEMVPVGKLIVRCPGLPGRPAADRGPLLRAFMAKAVHGIALTSLLIERLRTDKTLRMLCGWSRASEVPSEATFSRAFAEFAAGELPTRLHEALIVATHADRLVGHIARDSTAIAAREKPVKVETAKRCRKKKRPRRGEPGWEHARRLERQPEMSLAEMLADLPRHCSVGVKPDARGRKSVWIGYKLHLDVADGGIPLTGLITSASLHDSQAAIPLTLLTSQRVVALYELMDSAYQAPEIIAAVRAQGRVPIIPEQARREKGRKAELDGEARARRHANYQTAEQVRYRERTTAERVNGRLKDEFGGRHVRVRGAAKVMCHLMLGVLVLTVDQLMRLIS